MANSYLLFLSKLKYFFILSLLFFSFCFFPQSVWAYSATASATMVIGQPNFTSSGTSATKQGLHSPAGLTSDGSHLVVADSINNRIVIYNAIPSTNNPIPDVIIGQPDFVSSGANQSGTVAGNTLNNPTQMDFAGDKLLVTDTANNRVLIFSKLPQQNNVSADVVIGQTDMQSNANAVSATQLMLPNSVAYDSLTGRLAIADTSNNRILLYNSIPSTNNQAADIVLGQTDFVSNGAAVRQDALSSPHSVKFINGKLVVADTGNNRMLIWNTPTTNGQAADVVIGQTNFTSNSSNQGGSTGANTLSSPVDAAFDGTRFIITDQGNNRLLIFNTVPSSNNLNADQVLGQTNFTNATLNYLNTPAGGLISVGRLLFVCDTGYNRVLSFYNYSSTTAMSLTNMPLGQPNGQLRMYGNITLTNFYKVQGVQFQVNSGNWQGATAVDGGFDDPNEDFYINYDPTSNKKNDGYTLHVRATNTNNDLLDNLFYFEPFKLNGPTDGYSTSSIYPSFDFSVNKQLQTMTDNLLMYQIWIKRPKTNRWRLYLSSIPIDFNTVRLSPDNSKRGNYPTYHNGIYETNTLSVVYSEDSSRIVVQGKNTQVISGTYQWKIVALDKAGHTEESNMRTITINSRRRIGNTEYFPLGILSISGIGPINLTSLFPWRIRSLYTTSLQNPTIFGIAPRNALVSLSITDPLCKERNQENCTQEFVTTADSNSRFGINLPNNLLKQRKTYAISLSDVLDNKYNELPAFKLKIDNPQNFTRVLPQSHQTIINETPGVQIFQKNKSLNEALITPQPTNIVVQTQHHFCLFQFCF